MNKLFTKIAGVTLGFAMAIGVGVAVAGKQDAKATKADETGSYTLTFDANTSSSGTGSHLSSDYNTALTAANVLTYGTYSFKSGSTYYWLVSGSNNVSSVSSTANCYPGANQTIKVGKAKGDGTLNFTVNGDENLAIDSVVITAYGDASKITIAEANSATKTWTLSTTSSQHTFTYASGVKTVSLTGGKGTTSSNKPAYISQIVINYTISSGDAPTLDSVSVSGNLAKTSYTTVDSWSYAGLTATANYSDSSSTDVTDSADWAFTPHATPTAAVLANSNNEITNYSLTATATAGGKSGSKETTGVSVSYATVAELTAATPATGDLVGIIAKGIVSEISEVSVSNGNATYYISDDGTTSNQYYVYRGKNVGNTNFTNVNDIMVGDVVVIYGTVTNFSGTTKEFKQGNYILSLDRPASETPTITITEANFSMFLGDADVTLHETHENVPEGGSIKWTSSKAEVATINEDTGVVHAVGIGNTEISAKIIKGDEVLASNSISITVVKAAVSVGQKVYFYAEYNETTYYMASVGSTSSINEEDKVTFTVEAGSVDGTFAFKNGSNYLKCTNSSPYLGSGADKDSTTSWTALDNGTEIIVASVSTTTRSIMWNYNNNSPRFGAYNNTSASILRVQIGKSADPTYVTLNKTETTIENGASETLTYTTDQYVEFLWTSSNPAVATVSSSGLVECLSNAGTTTIRVFFDANGNGVYDDGEPTSTCVVTAAPAQTHFGEANYGGIGTLLESANNLAGKKVIIGRNDVPAVAGSLSGSFFTAVDNDTEGVGGVSYDSTNKKMTVGNGRTDTGVTVFTLEAITGGYAFKTTVDSEVKYLRETSAKNVTLGDEAQAWTIAISNGTATITSTNGNAIQYNTSNPRFTTYASAQASVELYDYKSYYEEATEYAEYFVGGTTGTCEETINDWSDLELMFADLTVGAQNIYKIATHNAPESYDHEISVEHAVARYDDALLKHTELRTHEFMGRTVEGTLSYSAFITSVSDSNDVAIIVVIIAIASISAFGCLLILKKRKHQ